MIIVVVNYLLIPVDREVSLGGTQAVRRLIHRFQHSSQAKGVYCLLCCFKLFLDRFQLSLQPITLLLSIGCSG